MERQTTLYLKEKRMKSIYLDNAATSPVDPRVKEAMLPFFENEYGNPSSIHTFGQTALDAIEVARREVAGLIGAEANDVFFTGSGTESDNTALWSVAYALKEKGNHIITSQIEHHAILHCAEFMKSQGYKITFLPVDSFGQIDPDDVKKAITPETILISIMHANNEIGTIQPIEAIGTIAKEADVLFHTDAVQTTGHEPIDVNAMHIDLLSISAHKLYGPKGSGALYLKEGTPFVPFIHGGGQENGRRSATHNVPGIVGLGKSCAIASQEMQTEHKTIEKLRNQLWQRIQENIVDVQLNGHSSQRLANNLNINIDKVEGESLIMQLDMEGVAASSASACSAGSDEPSHVLKAIGLSNEQCRGSLRLSLGRFNTTEEIDQSVEILTKIVSRLRALSSF